MKTTLFTKKLYKKLSNEKNVLKIPNSLSYSDEFKKFVYFEVNIDPSTQMTYNEHPVTKLWLIMDQDGYRYGSIGIFFGDGSVKFYALNSSRLVNFKTLFLEAKATPHRYYQEFPIEIIYSDIVRKSVNDPSVIKKYYSDIIKNFYLILHNFILGLINNLIESLNPKPKAISLIELGCGDGAFLRLIGNKQQELK